MKNRLLFQPGPPSLSGGFPSSLLLANVSAFHTVKPCYVRRSIKPLNIELKRASFDSFNRSAILKPDQ